MMKSKLLNGLVFTLATVLSLQSANAQCKGWNWPEDKATAEEKNVLYSDAVKAKSYREAVAPWQWLMTNAPNLNSSIYINGIKMYNALAKAEKDPTKKTQLIDSLLWIHDRRVESGCGTEKKVFPRRTFYNYVFNVKDKAKTIELYNDFEKVFKLLGKEVDKGNAQAYVTVLTLYQKRHKKLTDNEVMDKYDRLIEVIDHQVAKGKNTDKWETIRTKADDMLAGLIDISCEFVKANLEPRFKKNPQDGKLADRIFKFMLIGKCTNDPLWLEAGEIVYAKKPDYGLAKNLGLKSKAKGDKAKAESYFNKALELASQPSQKADMYLQLGHIQAEKGAKQAARSFYRKAIAEDGSKREAYKHIGNLYFGSFSQCAGKEDMAKDRLVYIAAYNQFQKAGNAKLMNAAKAQFPSVEEIFTQNYNKGDVMTVGCWINEKVTLDTRD